MLLAIVPLGQLWAPGGSNVQGLWALPYPLNRIAMNVFKSFFFFALLSALLLLTTSCGENGICTSGKGSSDMYSLNLPEFTGIDLRMNAKVFLRQGENRSVEVFGQENIVDRLKLDVDDLTWKIDLEGCNRDYETLEIYLTLPELDEIKISGSGDVVGETAFVVDDVDMLISGSGNLSMSLDADHVNTKVSGSGNIYLILAANQLESEISGSGDLFYSGEVPTHFCHIRGSGETRAFALITDSTEIKISGSGSAELFARTQLDINITGSGDVRYRGTSALNIDIDGSGRVIDAN